MRMETLSKLSSKFLAAWLGPGLSIPRKTKEISGKGWVVAEQLTAHRCAANPPKAQQPSHGATACKSVPGIHWQGKAKDVRSVILPKFLWRQQALHNDNSDLIPNLIVLWEHIY